MFSSGSHSWDGLIVLCAGNNYDTIKVADQHLADELAKLAPVLYIDPPVSCLTPLRDRTQAEAAPSGPQLRAAHANRRSISG
jgi:teichuronic acid biosynthesis glycosyltransferase TuaH